MNYRHIYMHIIMHAKKEEALGLRKKLPVSNPNFKYYEKHHILPKSLFPQWAKEKRNMILLTAKEHFFCHKLLTKIYPTKQMFLALTAFICRPNADIKKDYKITLKEYENLRIQYSQYLSNFLKTHPENGFSNSAKGKKWFTDGINNKFCYDCPKGFRPGRTFSKEHLANIHKINSALRKGSKASEETKAKMRANCGRAIGERNSSFGKKWYTDGTNNILAFKCPNGFHLGRTISKESIEKQKLTKKCNPKPAWNKGMNKASQKLYHEKLQKKVRSSPVLANNLN